MLKQEQNLERYLCRRMGYTHESVSTCCSTTLFLSIMWKSGKYQLLEGPVIMLSVVTFPSRILTVYQSIKPSALFQLPGLHASKSDENYVIGKLIYVFQHWNTPVNPIYMLQLKATEISFWFQWYLDQALHLDHLWGRSWYSMFLKTCFILPWFNKAIKCVINFSLQ